MKKLHISRLIKSKRFQIPVAALACIAIGASAAAIVMHTSLNQDDTVNSSVSDSPSSLMSTSTGQVNKAPSQSKPSSSPSSSSSQVTELQKQAFAAQEKANHEQYCLNTDQFDYKTFTLKRDSDVTIVETETSTILNNHQLTFTQKNEAITQVYIDYNSTVDKAFATYMSDVKNKGCQPSSTSPPYHYPVPFNG